MQFIQRAQAGDREAFASLFEQYKNLVYKTAYLMLGNREEAEDALQEVFVAVHRSLAGFDPQKGAFSTWLHRVTFNYCLNQHRKRRMLSLEELSGVFASEFPGEQLAEKQLLEQALWQLSERQKAVVTCVTFGNCRMPKSPPSWKFRWEQSNPVSIWRSKRSGKQSVNKKPAPALCREWRCANEMRTSPNSFGLILE